MKTSFTSACAALLFVISSCSSNNKNDNSIDSTKTDTSVMQVPAASDPVDSTLSNSTSTSTTAEPDSSGSK